MSEEKYPLDPWRRDWRVVLKCQ